MVKRIEISLGIERKIKRNNDSELNENEKLQNLAHIVALLMYQDYKADYSKQATKHIDDCKNCLR